MQIFYPFDVQRIADLQNSARYLQRLDTEECLSKYSSRIITGRQDVVAVVRRERYLSPDSGVTYTGFQNGSLIHVARIKTTSRQSRTQGYKEYFCSDLGNLDVTMGTERCGVDSMKSTFWHVFGYPVVYCLSRVIDQHCRLEFSQAIAFIIVVCNALKLCCIIYTALSPREDTLCTQG